MSNKKQNSVRIISGLWRGRKLHFPSNTKIRPTTNAIRETLFNWLMPVLPNARCLDLFAGSGALGFEALSRGAAHVTFIDSDKAVVDYLKSYIELLNANAEVHQFQIPTNRKLSKLKPPYDVVFMDPPFQKNLIEPCCIWLEQNCLLANNSFVYTESESQLDPIHLPSNWEILRKKTTGHVTYYLIRHKHPLD